jgi:hypothetical protein
MEELTNEGHEVRLIDFAGKGHSWSLKFCSGMLSDLECDTRVHGKHMDGSCQFNAGFNRWLHGSLTIIVVVVVIAHIDIEAATCIVVEFAIAG